MNNFIENYQFNKYIICIEKYIIYYSYKNTKIFTFFVKFIIFSLILFLYKYNMTKLVKKITIEL